MAKKKEIDLTVAEARYQNDVGRNLVRMDEAAMSELGVKQGDVVEIAGSKASGAIALRNHPEDKGLNIIRIDGLLRRNAGASIGEKATLRKAELQEAKRVTLAPAEAQMQIMASGEALKRSLLGRPLSKGDVVTTTGPGSEMLSQFFGSQFFGLGEVKFVVANTNPRGIVLVTDMTDVQVSQTAMKVEEAARAPAVTYEDVGGLRDEIQRVREMVELPLRHPELFDRLGIDPPKGVLLHGPPGTGKTMIAKAVSAESEANFISLAGPEIMSKFYGESEANLRDVFKEAEQNAPSIIFIDEIDAIAPKREEVTGEVERRVVSQLLALMDGLQSRGKVIVIAATNRPNALDPALRRPGRFDREIVIGVPSRDGRKEILQIHTRGMPLEKDVDLDEMARTTHGYVGADLAALAREAAMNSLRQVLPEIKLEEQEIPQEILEKLRVGKKDFQAAMRQVEPSAMREVMVQVPDVHWNDVGGLEGAKQELREAVEWPLKHPEAFKRLGIEPPHGILVYGPPGTGKTLLARAVATEGEANFISIKGPELLSKWVGESERGVRETFRKARTVAPTVVFFDEIDAMVPRRGSGFGDSHVSERVLSQLLTELDGLEKLENVVVIGATNRPDLIDPALLRPGRFDRLIGVPAPDGEARLEILKIHTQKMSLAKGVDLKVLAAQTDGFAGSDLAGLAREAAMLALRKDLKAKEVNQEHFLDALKGMKPSITKEVAASYDRFGNRQAKAITKEVGEYY